MCQSSLPGQPDHQASYDLADHGQGGNQMSTVYGRECITSATGARLTGSHAALVVQFGGQAEPEH